MLTMLEENFISSAPERTLDLSTNELDSVAYPRLSGCMVKNDVSGKLLSPTKQVRFRSNITVSSVDPPAKELSTHDFTEDDLDDLTLITSMSFANPNSPARFHSTQASYDTSVWFDHKWSKMSSLSVNTEYSPQNNCPNFPSLRTSDHIPQQPLSLSYSSVYNSRNYGVDFRSSNDQEPREVPSYTFSYSDNLSLSSLTELDSLDADIKYSSHDGCSISDLDLSQPKYNTAKTLKREIKDLSLKISSNSEMPADEIRLEAECIVNEACRTRPFGNDSINPLILNPRITVNIPEHDILYTNLIDLSVDESEIVRLERQRVATQRKMLDAQRRQSAKDKVIEPEPDLLEFFDPNRHVYQSVNLQTKGLPNLLPSLHCAPMDSLNSLYDKITCDFSCIHNV
ncbi:unnamed protein product [Heterobilharzia americana]|nr:unnamed protein product [Heterobilharzia americana]